MDSSHEMWNPFLLWHIIFLAAYSLSKYTSGAKYRHSFDGISALQQVQINKTSQDNVDRTNKNYQSSQLKWLKMFLIIGHCRIGQWNGVFDFSFIYKCTRLGSLMKFFVFLISVNVVSNFNPGGHPSAQHNSVFQTTHESHQSSNGKL